MAAKVVAALVVAYAISPVDLIPDFIPVLGYLDDLVLLPAGIWLALQLIPQPVMEGARRKAAQTAEQPTSRVAATAIILVWLLAASLLGLWAYNAWLR